MIAIPKPRVFIVAMLSMVFSINISFASNVEYVTVTTFGTGITKQLAIQDAIVAGLERVNGQVMSATERSSFKSAISYVAGVKDEQSRESLSQDVLSKTKGVIRTWSLQSVETLNNGDIEATVEVSVGVLKTPKQLNRSRIAIVTSDQEKGGYSSRILPEITTLLTSSRKFAVLDRANTAAIERELKQIESDGNIEDMVRLSSGIAPDLLAVIKTKVLDVDGNKKDLSAVLEVIDYSTRQIKFSRKTVIRLIESDSASKTNRKIVLLAKRLHESLIEKVAQPTVIGINNEAITIGQGKDFFSIGDIVLLQRQGEVLIDQYTGESLGSDLTSIGQAEITFVNPNISIARIHKIKSELSYEDVAKRRVVVSKQRNPKKSIKEMKKSTKAFLDDI